MRIAIDCMGGDNAPDSIIAGLSLFIKEKKFDFKKLFLVGKEDILRSKLQEFKIPPSNLEIVHSQEVISMSDSPSLTLRGKKDCSINKCANLIKENNADALVSAGNTGATVTTSVFHLKMLGNVHRPGISILMPTEKSNVIFLDAGATVDNKADHLLQYAIMASVFAKEILNKTNPRVGLLNVGEEENKGNGAAKEAFELLKKSDVNFIGNIEGNDIFSDKADIVICDGFIGNIVLKTVEGTVNALSKVIKNSINKSFMRRIFSFFLRNAFKEVKQVSHYSKYGGAPLLGVNGHCIIAHGSSSGEAIKNAIEVACKVVEQNINQKIEDKIKNLAL